MSKTLVLEEGIHFTTKGLKEKLNNVFGNKKTGEKFTIGDVQQYIRYGRIPEKYGGAEIMEYIDNTEIGIKVARLSKPFIKQ